MAGKRKRAKEAADGVQSSKRPKLLGNVEESRNIVKSSVLAQYYDTVVTLREFILRKLPEHSKIRRRRIVSLGRIANAGISHSASIFDDQVTSCLDKTLVGVRRDTVVQKEERIKQWASFSQRNETSFATTCSILDHAVFSQSEIIDFVIWICFTKASKPSSKTQHLLMQGFKRAVSHRPLKDEKHQSLVIPGLISATPNYRVAAMKASPWPQILSLLGKEGEKIMIDLVLDCGIFAPVDGGRGNYHQLSGQPLADLQLLNASRRSDMDPGKVKCAVKSRDGAKLAVNNTSSNILFVRSRIFYGKATQNASGRVVVGFRHIHVLNRFKHKKSLNSTSFAQGTDTTDDSEEYRKTIHVLMYLFPRQFGFHNVFTSSVDRRETVQRFRDYTLREDEIKTLHAANDQHGRAAEVKIPKRLRGCALDLVKKLRISHSRCAYKELLNHYCHAFSNLSDGRSVLQTAFTEKAETFDTQISVTNGSSVIETNDRIFSPTPSILDHATSQEQVSAFCRAALSNLVPNDFWGVGDVQNHNRSLFLHNVDRFIKLRRFENLSLHEVIQGMKINGIPWLSFRNNTIHHTCQSDTHKRLELFHEFMYYLFDSLLIPLIHTNFYVTESNKHRYRVLFFRQDVWRSLAEPAISSLKVKMFEEVNREKADEVLIGRSLGYSLVRLLPKEAGLRPIMNLRRRAVKNHTNGVLGSSINSLLAPVHNMLSYEKKMAPSRLGATLFSVGDLHQKLKAFKDSLAQSSHSFRPLYFAKVDVQSAFDTIPQTAVLKLMSTIPQESVYHILKYAEVKPGEDRRLMPGQDATLPRSKPIRNFIATAGPQSNYESFVTQLETTLAVSKKHTVFIDNIVSQFRDRDGLLTLLTEHIANNLVKIGKKFYRQKVGIPQGSVLSSLLCNYFYADLEAQHLSFLQSSPRESFLVRLIDDFLLITTNQSHAKQFLQMMHTGFREYGVTVNPSKTLVNFEISINDSKITRVADQNTQFPYCGLSIDTKTLNISRAVRDPAKTASSSISDSLTVEFSKLPGRTFHRKVVNSFKIQAHALYTDSAHNSLRVVCKNIYEIATESAAKMWMYVRCLPVGKRPGWEFIVRTIQDLCNIAFLLLKSKRRKKGNEAYRCAVSKEQVEWLTLTAFYAVLSRKQSNYKAVVAWIRTRKEKIEGKLSTKKRFEGAWRDMSCLG